MMNSNIQKLARETIEIITAKLDRSLIKSRFDEPIAKVVWEYKCEAKPPVSHKAFNKIVADFIKQIYEKALKTPWVLTNSLAETIFLLENYYRSPAYGPGYAGAIMNANDAAEGGIQTVLTGLAESIKSIERQKYIEGVFTWHLHSCSWELLCEIAKLLLEDYKPFIPPLLFKCIPAQLVDEIPEIMYRYICSDFTLQQISFCNEKPITAYKLSD